MRNEVMVNWCILQVRFTSFHRHSTGLTKLYQHVDALGLLQWFHHGLQWRNHGNCQTPTRNSININKHNNDHEHETHFKVIQNQVVKSNQCWNLWNKFWMLHIFVNISWHYKRMQSYSKTFLSRTCFQNLQLFSVKQTFLDFLVGTFHIWTLQHRKYPTNSSSRSSRPSFKCQGI